MSKKVSFSHGGIALFSCLKSHFLFNSGLPHIWTGVALLFGSSQSRLSEGTSSYLILWIRCFNGPEQKRLLKFLQLFFLSDQDQISASHLSSSQFQHLFSCSPDSKRRKRMMSKSSPYPVEGISKNISPMVENFPLCPEWSWISLHWPHSFQVMLNFINKRLLKFLAAGFWPLMILLDKENRNSEADNIIVWALPAGLVTTIFPISFHHSSSAAHILWILGDIHI